MYSLLIQSLPTLLLAITSCLPTIAECHHRWQLRHVPSNNRQSNDYIDPINMDEPSTESSDTPTLSPSSFHMTVEEDTPPTSLTTTSYGNDNDDTPYPPLPLPISAFQSKMTPSLVQLHSTESSSPPPTTTTVPSSQPSSSTIDGAPSKLSSTITPPTLNTSYASTNKLFQQNEHLSFTTSLHDVYTTDDDELSASNEVVHCNNSSSNLEDAIEPYHMIESPYYYQIETTQQRSTIIQIATVEKSILSVMADRILTCDHDKEEDIRYRALSNEELKSRVVAISSDQNKREYACSDTSTSQHCHIVEGKLTLFVQDMSVDNEEDRIISKAYTTIELVLHSLDNTNNRDTSDRLSYVGNNSVSLLPADKLTKVSDTSSPSSSSEDAAGIFITIFLVLSVCGCLGAIVVICTFSRRLVNNKEESLHDSDDEESQTKSGVSNNTLSSSSGDSSTDPIDAQEVDEVDWNRMVYIESLALSQLYAPMFTPLARLFNTQSRVTASSITKVLRDAVSFLGPTIGFLPSDVTARCLQASGATALLLARVDTDIISLIGRWRSDEMLRYLHIQAYPLMKDYSRRMLNAGDYSLIPNGLNTKHCNINPPNTHPFYGLWRTMAQLPHGLCVPLEALWLS